MTDAAKSFATDTKGEEFGTAKTMAGYQTLINVQARDRFGNLQNEGRAWQILPATSSTRMLNPRSTSFMKSDNGASRYCPPRH